MIKNLKSKLFFIEDYFIITLGLMLYALSWTLFILPAQITGGGVSGIGAVIFYATGFPVGVTYFLVNVVLVTIAIRILGSSFGIKTFFSIAIITLALTFSQQLVKTSIINDTFLSSVLGGSPGRVILYCDVIIIASSYAVLGSIDKLVYGYVSMAVTSYALDSVLSGANRSAQMLIFSSKYDEIADFINLQKYRGVTVVDGIGWYSKDNVKVVISVVRKRETGAIFRKIKEIDPNAFISMGSVMGVYGQGFDQLKL